jgi:hypothetical protein
MLLNEQKGFIMATIIYDPYGIESVISAAVLLKERPELFTGAIAFNGEMVPSGETNFIKVLCDLDEQTLVRFSKISKDVHIFNIDNMLRKEAVGDAENDVDDGVVYSILRHVYRRKPSPELYQLVLALDFFKRRNSAHYDAIFSGMNSRQRIQEGLLLHARVFEAFKQALKALFTARRFEYDTQDYTAEYMEFLAMLKGNMKQYLSISNIELSGKRITVPMMNSNINEAAWLKQYLQAVYPHGILYEVKGLNIIAITWSPERNLEKKFSLVLKEAISKEYRVVFAGRD